MLIISASGSPAQYLGCFRDAQTRDMPERHWQSADMTIQRCVADCRQHGYRYAGVQFSTHCFCSNSYGRYGAADNCDMGCGGNNSQTCGGTWANSVYGTGGGGPRLYRSRWDQIGGSWTTGWVPNHPRPVCGHTGPGRHCGCGDGRTSACGEYPSGATITTAPFGCANPTRWTLQCTSEPQ